AEARVLVLVDARRTRLRVGRPLLPVLGAGIALTARGSGRILRIRTGLPEVAFLLALTLVAHCDLPVMEVHDARGAHSAVVVRDLAVLRDKFDGFGER